MRNKKIKKKMGMIIYNVFTVIYILFQIVVFLFMWKEGCITSIKTIIFSVLYLVFSGFCMHSIKSTVLSGQFHFWFLIVKIILSVQIFDGAKQVILSVAVITLFNILASLICKVIVRLFGLDPYNPSYID